jgi:precorrin-2 dehydrogenase
MYPLFLNVTNRLAVVVGSGDVGRRKARALFDAGARVRLVCLEPCTADGATGRLEWLNEPYRDEHLEGAALAIAAATPEINQAVVADARRRGIWVNSAGEPDAGDFVLPATIRRGDFLLAIGTGGAAPSLAQRVREQLELAFDKSFGEWVALLAELRPDVREKIVDPDRRAAIYLALTDWGWLDQLRANGIDRVRADMLAALDRWAAEYNGKN